MGDKEMKELSGPERVIRARRKRELSYFIHDIATDIWKAVTTVAMYVGIGTCIGIGCGCGLALVVALI